MSFFHRSLDEVEQTSKVQQLPPADADAATRPEEVAGTPGPVAPNAHNVPKSRTGMAWMAACTTAVLAIALIIFMIQNTQSVEVSFLWMSATTSLALMLLVAAVGGIVLTLLLGTARIMQLRHLVHKQRP